MPKTWRDLFMKIIIWYTSRECKHTHTNQTDNTVKKKMVDKSIRYNGLKNIFLLHLLSNKSYFLRDIFILYQIFFLLTYMLFIYLFIQSFIYFLFIRLFIYLFATCSCSGSKELDGRGDFLDFINFFP